MRQLIIENLPIYQIPIWDVGQLLQQLCSTSPICCGVVLAAAAGVVEGFLPLEVRSLDCNSMTRASAERWTIIFYLRWLGGAQIPDLTVCVRVCVSKLPHASARSSPPRKLGGREVEDEGNNRAKRSGWRPHIEAIATRTPN